MRRIAITCLILFTIYIALGVWISGRSVSIMNLIQPITTSSPFYSYSGVINVHTSASSGSGTYETIVAAAKETNTDFVIVTDTGNYSPDLSAEGYYDKVMLLVGGEYAYLDSRILNFGFSNTEHLMGPGRTQVVFSELLSQAKREQNNGLFVLAHPSKPGYKWVGALPAGLNGIEIFNLKSIWQTAWRSQKLDFFATTLIYPLHPEWALLRMFITYPQQELAIWDKALTQNKIYGYAGADADARLKLPRGKRMEFPSYKRFFSILKNHVLLTSELTGRFESDRNKILDALKNGNFYVAVDLIGRPKNFSAFIVDTNEKAHLMGSTVSRAKTLNIELGERPTVPFEVVVYQNGEQILSSTSATTVHKLLSPGTYRVAVRVRAQLPFPDGREWLTWIITNPFFVRDL